MTDYNLHNKIHIEYDYKIYWFPEFSYIGVINHVAMDIYNG